MKPTRIFPTLLLLFVLAACEMPPITPTPAPTPTLTLALSLSSVTPVPTVVIVATETPSPTPTRPLLYLPVIEVAPTPSPREAYRQAMLAWLQEVMRWTDELEAVMSVVSPSAPEWQPALTNFETRLLALEAHLHTLTPPTGYVNAHEMMLVSMDACTDAITHYKNTDFGFGDLSLAVCTSGIILATSRLP